MTIFRALLAVLLALPTAAQVRLAPGLAAHGAPRVTLSVPLTAPALTAPVLSAPALAPALSAPSAPQAPRPVLPPARTDANLRADADRLYAALADIHSREMNGEDPAALAQLKRALLADFDGAIARAPVARTGADLRAQIKAARAERAAAEKALDAASPAARLAASRTVAAVSGGLAALQLSAARELLSDASPVKAKAFRRNAALWTLVGAHNSAALASVEAAYQEALARGEEAFGDGRPYLVWNRWRDLHAELEAAATDAGRGRKKAAFRRLQELATILADTGDEADAKAARGLMKLAANPVAWEILVGKLLIKHPVLKVRTAVAYKDMAAGLRSMVHTLSSGREDYLEVAAREADLRRAAALWGSRRASAAEKRTAERLARDAREWALRGRVEAKRLAASNLEAALIAAERGDHALAARHAEWTADALAERREEIRRIGLSVQKRLIAALAR